MITSNQAGLLCGATAVFWPEAEACEAECWLPADHPGTRHQAEILGDWDEDELSTQLPRHRAQR